MVFPSAIARAKEIKPPEFKHIDFKVCDVVNIPMKDGVIDLVTEVACLECLTKEHAASALSQVTRIIKPDGLFVSITKADGWDHFYGQVGRGSRQMKEHEAHSLYGRFFHEVQVSRDDHFDGSGQGIIDWIVVCRRPKCGTSSSNI